MLRAAITRLGSRGASSSCLASALKRPVTAASAASPLKSTIAAAQLPLRASLSSWLGPPGRLGSARGVSPTNRPEKAEGDEESTTTPSTGPFFYIKVFDVEQATDHVLKQHYYSRQPPLGFLLLHHDFRQASLDDIVAGPEEELTMEGEKNEDEDEGGMQLIKRTYQPSVIKKKRTHGFLVRLRTKDGRKILERRKRKNRARMAI